MLMNSILFNTDSYKVSMWKQYPEGTEIVYSYIMPRVVNEDVVVFGLQAYLLDYLSTAITQHDIELADMYWTAHGEPFNRAGWEYILKEHNGFLPISIKCVPEGSVVPSGNVIATIENTDSKVPWLTTWVETSLLRAMWYPSSVASNSFAIKRVINKALVETGDESTLDFKLHDFGARGCSSNETASLGGAAHLINFSGTDTYVGVLRAIQSYAATIDNIGFSIPAAEHSTITSWGRDKEVDAYANMVAQFSKPGSIYAVVSDSYDVFKACEMWGSDLREAVISGGGTLVVRPDSGEPTKVLPEMLNILESSFGITNNAKGYKVLNNVRLIWGDGINIEAIKRILFVLEKLQWSADNIAFGMGSALLGRPQRDDLGWAMKCSAVRVNGVWRDVFKDPVTAKDKKSVAGRVTLMRDKVTGKLYSGREDWTPSVLEEVFLDGRLVKFIAFDQVRKNTQAGL